MSGFTGFRAASAVLAAMSALAACGGGGGGGGGGGLAIGAAPDIFALSASEVAASICNGTFTSESVTRGYLARAKARPDLNAFVTLDEAGAIKAAQAADARRNTGAECLPLQGVPIVVKDNIQSAGLPATAGTPALKDFVPAADAPVLKSCVMQGRWCSARRTCMNSLSASPATTPLSTQAPT